MRYGRSDIFFHITLILFAATRITAQDYYEEHHRNKITSQIDSLPEIPTRFEVKGENALATFKQYIAKIQDLASKANLAIVYKVKVNTVARKKHKNLKKDRLNKTKSKKYNVPLKKKNMKLSSFEIVLRKRANDVSFKHSNYVDGTTTETQKVIFTTRPTSAGKYKPIINGVKTNYTKIIRPLKNKIITLES